MKTNERTWFKRLAATMLALAVAFTMILMSAMPALAEEKWTDTTVSGVKIRYWYEVGVHSVAIKGVEGTPTAVVLPASISFDGKEWPASPSGAWFFIEETAFSGNTKITSIAIPDTYGAVDKDSFKGCTNLKTYYWGDAQTQSVVENSGIGTDASGKPIAGVIVWTKAGSNVDKAIQKLNNTRGSNVIMLKYSDNPYKQGGGNTDKETKGADGTAYGKGASESLMNRAITKWAKETDPKGSVFGILQARLYNAKKTSLTLKWTKAKGAAKYIVYGNKCGKKNKLIKQTTTKKTKVVYKKVAKKESQKRHLLQICRCGDRQKG